MCSGSHRWRPQRGIFTINAKIYVSYKNILDQELSSE